MGCSLKQQPAFCLQTSSFHPSQAVTRMLQMLTELTAAWAPDSLSN